MERITLKNESIETAKSAAPIATLPHPGRYCRMNSNRAGMSSIPCASTDIIPAAVRWIFLDNDKGMRFMGRVRRGEFFTIVIHHNPIFTVLPYDIESINLI